MNLNKRGQFFILAAVIISAVILSLSTTYNYINTNKQQETSLDLTYQLKSESAQVSSYGVYSGNDELQNFLNIAVTDMQYKDPNAEVVVLYGDKNSATVENWAKGNIKVEGKTIPGGADLIEGYTYLNNVRVITYTTRGEIYLKNPDDPGLGNKIKENIVPVSSQVTVLFNDIPYTFTLTGQDNFYVIIKKTSKNENDIQTA
ncbi:MAG: hypothetical protein Q7S33_00950 [Nanoarchaeota archaeon]|nr:hypothetical protein [Nanoarchaeota archaeon]